MKLQIFIIKNGFIVFQSILQHDFMRSNHLSKQHSFWTSTASTASSGDENSWLRFFFLMCSNKKKSGLYGGWPINSMFWPIKKALLWADVWEFALPWWTIIRLLLFVFRISPKNLGKEIVVYHSEWTAIRCSSGTVATWPVLPKKQATICFEVLLSRTTFVGFGSSSNTNIA